LHCLVLLHIIIECGRIGPAIKNGLIFYSKNSIRKINNSAVHTNSLLHMARKKYSAYLKLEL